MATLGRLTIRQLQERRRKAEEAFHACKELSDRWHGYEYYEAERAGVVQQRLQAVQQQMAEHVAAIRAGLPNDRFKIGFALSLSGMVFLTITDYRRALPIFREAVNLLKPPQDRMEAGMLNQCVSQLGTIFRELGWLQDAEALYREVLATEGNRSENALLAKKGLAQVYRELGRYEEALRYVDEAQRLAVASEHYEEDRMEDWFLMTRAAIYEDMGQEEEGWACRQKAFQAFAHDPSPLTNVDELYYYVLLAKRLLREGQPEAALQALYQKNAMAHYVNTIEDGGIMMQAISKGVAAARLHAEVALALGFDEEGAARLEADLDETEAIRTAYNQALYDEMLVEIRAEQAAAAGAVSGAGGAGSGGGKKKLTRKQQKRRAAQRRKAEARAAAEGAAGAAGAAEAADEKEKREQDEGVEEVATTAAQLQIEEPEPEPEPEECAICLGDLPAPGADGCAVLLACSHAFHADCLQRWKDKCLEKGVLFTCAMCRGAVSVVAP